MFFLINKKKPSVGSRFQTINIECILYYSIYSIVLINVDTIRFDLIQIKNKLDILMVNNYTYEIKYYTKYLKY